ncbi:hypothetical protein IWW50_006920, partial [Coemansia erecta]
MDTRSNSSGDGSPRAASAGMPVQHSAAKIAAHHYSETADFQRMRASLAEAITQGVSKAL